MTQYTAMDWILFCFHLLLLQISAFFSQELNPEILVSLSPNVTWSSSEFNTSLIRMLLLSLYTHSPPSPQTRKLQKSFQLMLTTSTFRRGSLCQHILITYPGNRWIMLYLLWQVHLPPTSIEKGHRGIFVNNQDGCCGVPVEPVIMSVSYGFCNHAM